MTSTSSFTILTNSFHNTEYRTRKTREELEAIEWKVMGGTATESERAFARRVWRSLCGIADCTCSQNSFGERA